MKHVTIEELETVAAVSPEATRPLTRVERLNRWADLLEKRGGERLSTLEGTEFELPATRSLMTAANSAFSVAFADPILRGDGLSDETYGAAKRYFGLSDWELHDIVCYCHLGASTSAIATSRRVRAVASRWQPSLMARARQLFRG